ncbi:MAG: aminotransferase class IV [Candidatus Methanosuratincola sp.]
MERAVIPEVQVFDVDQEGLAQTRPICIDSLDANDLIFERGVYTVFRVYPGGKVLRFRDHLKRLAHSAYVLGMPLSITEGWLRQAVFRCLQRAGWDSARVRVTIPFERPNSAVIAIEVFTPLPESCYTRGVAVGLLLAQREYPTAKNTAFIEFRKAALDRQRDVFEIILQSADGYLLEGLSSNFYAILEGCLHTAGEGVLPGIARSILLEVAGDLLPVSYEPIHRADIHKLKEAFLSSSSRGVIPIVEIGGERVGNGEPGRLTKELRSRFEAQVETELELLWVDSF